MSKVPHNSWSILPASCIFDNKTKVTMEQVMNFWEDGTIVVCRKPNGNIGFIAGSGGSYAKIGSGHKCHHDQSWANLGYWEILAEVTYKKVDGEIEMSVVGSIAEVVGKKATIHVFK